MYLPSEVMFEEKQLIEAVAVMSSEGEFITLDEKVAYLCYVYTNTNKIPDHRTSHNDIVFKSGLNFYFLSCDHE